ncbi:MAG: DNA repair protein RecN [Anaerolineae bacterium]|nr:DNA repair protein RecN [Anaerolineae bacterium]
MLVELHIRNFAIIDELHLRFSPGLNVVTGETGAGKSIIVDAVTLLLGGKADAEMVRAGAERAEIEGHFALPPAAQAPDTEEGATLASILAAEGLEGEGDAIILAREVRREGRTVGRINGRAVSLSLLSEVGHRLVDIHNQGDHLSLLRVREHVALLDRYAGLGDLRARVAAEVRMLRQLRRELAALRQDERERARRIDLLTYQVEEIGAARLTPGEETDLMAERTRLANAEQLLALAGEALQALEDETGEQPGATDRLGEAVHALSRLARIDGDRRGDLQTAETLADSLSDLVRALRLYREAVEYNPERLQEVEERLNLIYNLKRKYGDSIKDIIAYGEQAARELETVSHAGERIAELEQEEEKRLRAIGSLGAELSRARRAAGERLARAVEQELEDLRMAKARFGVDIAWQDDPDGAYVPEPAEAGERKGKGKEKAAPAPETPSLRRVAFDATGLDRVEFLVSANPGEPLRPLAKVASGGETSRLMLALKAVLSAADATPTLIFDEIDVGIGGRVGAVVGRKLWGLTRQATGPGHQVLCVTHLPQLAAYGDAHLKVEKRIIGERTATAVTALKDGDRLGELAAMLGAETETARRSVAEMLEEVSREKNQA